MYPTLCLGMVTDAMASSRLMIVRPTIGAHFPYSMLDQELAWRLLVGSEDASCRVNICSSRELCNLPEDKQRSTTMLVVNPLQCLKTSGNETTFLATAALAHKRILASVEPAESTWYRRQLELPVHFDAVLDIGFASQRDTHYGFSDVPYHFVCNGPTKREQQTIAELSPPRKRSIPWTLAGYPTDDRLDLVTHLTEELDPGGFVFMPGRSNEPSSDRSTRRRALTQHDKISPSGLASVLSETSYYVWTSAHDFAYYESLRFVVALRAGAVPCKIADIELPQGFSQVPGIFSSVKSFCAAVQEEGASSMYRQARNFYLSRGLLASHLQEAIGLV